MEDDNAIREAFQNRGINHEQNLRNTVSLRAQIQGVLEQAAKQFKTPHAAVTTLHKDIIVITISEGATDA